MRRFAGRWKGEKPDGSGLRDRASAEAAMEGLGDLKDSFAEIKEKAGKLKTNCARFNLPAPRFTELEELDADVGKTVEAWALFEDYSSALAELSGERWLEIRERVYVMDDFLAKWAERLKGREVDAVVRFLYAEIERLRKNVPFLKFVKGDAFTDEHWAALFRMLAMPPGTKKAELTLQVMLDKSDHVREQVDAIKDLQARATAELTIREALQELTGWAIEAEFKVIEHLDASGRRVALIKEWKDVQTAVGDHQSVLQAMRDSPYFGKFQDEAEGWDKKLSILAMGLNDLNAVQRKWLYLEPIFGRGALPHEQQRFRRVDDEFRGIMAEVHADVRVVSFAGISGITEKLPVMIDQLERCQKALADFLEEKRSKFPRFYFIGPLPPALLALALALALALVLHPAAPA